MISLTLANRTLTSRTLVSRTLAPLLAVLVLGLLAVPHKVLAADDLTAVRTELEALRQSQDQTRNELAQLRKLLEGRLTPPQEPKFEPTVVDLGASPVWGEAKAPVVLLAFSDYQCPFCRRHAQQVLPDLVKNYVNTGKMKFVMKEFPIASLHPESARASYAALCAQDQGKYWEMHDLLFAAINDVSAETLKAHAAKLSLQAGPFAACLDGEQEKDRLAADMALGGKLGVAGTPTFFLGIQEPGSPGKVRLTARIPGAVGYPIFSGAIDALLAPANAKP